ncbi:hypothetical protein HNP84_004717 [Thermocatellispora tengchongensis]|uniref:Uncharacterized protein n=1 Tax=Thermocatellispora tengchongensis TaxID=1073253 RepID=A0A840PAM5_9ACTN|nr:hypothetical protein [Thermocatellispora tengchongensis]MBB5134983.1 hypothetical protein [Thermocatellispora tengchongensis]
MGELQLGDQERRQQEPLLRRRAARWQRVGWGSLALLLLAALAGLIGPGPLSWAGASAPLIQVDYERFARRLGDSSLRVTVWSDPAHPGTARLWISRDYLIEAEARQVVPAPDSWTAVDDGVVLSFPATGDRAEIEIRTSLDHIGTLHGALGVPGKPPARFWQLVYP